MTHSTRILEYIEGLDLPALSNELEKLTSTEAVVQVMTALRDRPEHLEEILLGLSVESTKSNVRRIPPPLGLPDPLLDDLCARSLFTDFSEEQLEAVAHHLVDEAYPRVSSSSLVKLMFDMSAREFGAAVVRDMQIAVINPPNKHEPLRHISELVVQRLRKSLVKYNDNDEASVDDLLKLLDGMKGSFAALYTLDALKIDPKGPLSLESVRDTLYSALETAGRTK